MRPQAMLEAKDLAKCDLSNYLTERLDSVLERDRALRAERDGCPLEAVSHCKSLPCTTPPAWLAVGLVLVFRKLLMLYAPLREACDGPLGFNTVSSMCVWSWCTCGSVKFGQRCDLIAEGLHSCLMSQPSRIWTFAEPCSICRCPRHLG